MMQSHEEKKWKEKENHGPNAANWTDDKLLAQTEIHSHIYEPTIHIVMSKALAQY
jgi:hypothetical protein